MHGPKWINLYHIERHQEFTQEKSDGKDSAGQLRLTTSGQTVWQNSEFHGYVYYKSDGAIQPTARYSTENFYNFVLNSSLLSVDSFTIK